jgi:hypothetical protein
MRRVVRMSEKQPARTKVNCRASLIHYAGLRQMGTLITYDVAGQRLAEDDQR